MKILFDNGAPKPIAVKRNGRLSKPAVSKLGRGLRKISDRIAASGLKPLSRREIEREAAERRGAR